MSTPKYQCEAVAPVVNRIGSGRLDPEEDLKDHVRQQPTRRIEEAMRAKIVRPQVHQEKTSGGKAESTEGQGAEAEEEEERKRNRRNGWPGRPWRSPRRKLKVSCYHSVSWLELILVLQMLKQNGSEESLVGGR